MPSIVALDADETVAHVPALRAILQDAVASGASVGFLPPLADAEADDYWASVVAALRGGSRVLLVAREAAGGIVGTVQLDLSPRANGRHRAEVSRLLVHRRARRQGLGRAGRALPPEGRGRGPGAGVMATQMALQARFAEAYRHVQCLERQGRYLGAFVFGSVARGEATARSDLDVKVIVDADNPCTNINHPVIGGVKLDLTFLALAQLRRDTEREMARAARVPMLAESVIVFDKTGTLGALRAWARQATPPRATPADFQRLRFSVYHVHNKVARAIEGDAPAALLALHTGLAELLDIDRRLQGRWEVSSKRLLPELRAVDPSLAGLVEAFVATADLHAKFQRWTDIVAHIARPLGGWADAENTCDCAVCRADLAALLHG